MQLDNNTLRLWTLPYFLQVSGNQPMTTDFTNGSDLEKTEQ